MDGLGVDEGNVCEERCAVCVFFFPLFVQVSNVTRKCNTRRFKNEIRKFFVGNGRKVGRIEM